MKLGLMLVSLWLVMAVGVARGQVSTTVVQDTVYRADGQAASGNVLVSWGSFTTADGTAVSAGSTTVVIGAGGLLNVALAPNAGATPMGCYYTAVFHLSDGTVSREFWVVPVSVPGGGPAKLAGIRNQVLPLNVAMQTVSKAYVDTTVAKAVAGVPPASEPWLLKTGDTMSGPLTLAGDPVNANDAADKHYVDVGVASAAGGTISASRLPVFGASGAAHAVGAVPDPGSVAGSVRYLREDGTWFTPASSGPSIPTGTAGGDLNGAYPNPVVSAVHATAGTLDGVAIGQTTPEAGNFTHANVGSAGQFQVDSSGRAKAINLTANAALNTTYRIYVEDGSQGQLALKNTNSASYTTFRLIGDAGYTYQFALGGSAVTPCANSWYVFDEHVGAFRLVLTPGGLVNIGGNCSPTGLFSVGSLSQFQVDSSGNTTAASYAGPASAPSGACSVSGAWVFSKDGHATFCNAGTWATKL